MQFIFTHNGRSIESDQSPEDLGMEDGDEILAVELMDLTEGPDSEEWVIQFRKSTIPASPLTGAVGRTSTSKTGQKLD